MPAEFNLKEFADKDGKFQRKASTFRNFISRESGAEFPPEKGRYVLYINQGCPWAHRANLVRKLKGLDEYIDLVTTGIDIIPGKGWAYDGEYGSLDADPLYGGKHHGDLYHKADPEYTGRFTVPVLWDRKKETIVNNESSEVIRMLYCEFDDLLPEEKREVNKPGGGYFPENFRKEIDELNAMIYDKINNGVYKTGFATSQAAYEENLYALFEALDKVEAHLSEPHHQPYLFGENITDADIRLYVSIVRFDAAYFTSFRCNLKMIRYDYPQIHAWLRRLYWDESERTNGGAFKQTTYFDAIKAGYARTQNGKIVPVGPLPNVLPLDESSTANGKKA